MRIRDDDEYVIRKMYRYVPARHIANKLGRSLEFVHYAARKIGVLPIDESDLFWMSNKLASEMGMSPKKARNMMACQKWTMTMYLGDLPKKVAIVDELYVWLKNPVNWIDIDVSAIVNERLMTAITIGQKSQADRYLTVEQVAVLLGRSKDTVRYLYRHGYLPHTKGSLGTAGAKVLIRQSFVTSYQQNATY